MATLDAIREKPVVQLTPDEIARLSEQERDWVIAFLALPPVKWPYSNNDAAAKVE